MATRPPKYKDRSGRTEDERIAEIGDKVMNQRLVVRFVVDGGPGDADRYVNKLQELYPGIVIHARGKNYRGKAIAHIDWIKVGPPI